MISIRKEHMVATFEKNVTFQISFWPLTKIAFDLRKKSGGQLIKKKAQALWCSFLKGAFYTLKHSVPKEDVDPIYYRRVLITKCTMAKLQKRRLRFEYTEVKNNSKNVHLLKISYETQRKVTFWWIGFNVKPIRTLRRAGAIFLLLL